MNKLYENKDDGGAPDIKEAAPADATGELLDMLGRIHPLAMDDRGDKEGRDERLRRPVTRQQPLPVPDQACVVWRWDLMHLMSEVTQLRAYKAITLEQAPVEDAREQPQDVAPTSVKMAKMMVSDGYRYLRRHAPELLVRREWIDEAMDGQEQPQGDRRDEFEQAMKAKGHRTERWEDGEYKGMTSYRWEGWSELAKKIGGA